MHTEFHHEFIEDQLKLIATSLESMVDIMRRDSYNKTPSPKKKTKTKYKFNKDMQYFQTTKSGEIFMDVNDFILMKLKHETHSDKHSKDSIMYNCILLEDQTPNHKGDLLYCGPFEKIYIAETT